MRTLSVVSSFAAFVAAYMCYFGRVELPAIVAKLPATTECQVTAGIFALLGLWLMTRTA